MSSSVDLEVIETKKEQVVVVACKVIDPFYYRTSWRTLSGHLWTLINIEIVLGALWLATCVFAIFFAKMDLVMDLRLCVLHIVTPLSVLWAIEFLYIKTEPLHYITKLSWLLPTIYTLVSEIISLYITIRLYQEFAHGPADPSLPWWSVYIYLAAAILNGLFVFMSVLSIWGLFRAHSAHGKRYPATELCKDANGNAQLEDSHGLMERHNSRHRKHKKCNVSKENVKLKHSCFVSSIESIALYLVVLVIVVAAITLMILLFWV